MKATSVLLLALAVSSLASCGQKGPLVRPGKRPAVAPAAATVTPGPASAASAAGAADSAAGAPPAASAAQ